MKAVIAVCKCSQSKRLYGIRFEKEGSSWKYTWAFPLGEKAAANEGFNETRITGPLIEGEEYPGCPCCGSVGFFLCGCGRLNCWNGHSQTVTCQWCGSSGLLGEDGIESINISENM